MNPNLLRPASGPNPSHAYDPSVEPAGLGVRTVGSDGVTGELHDVIRVASDLGHASTIEMAVRDRAEKFAAAELTGLSEVMRVRHAQADGRVEVISARAEGFRLSAVLEWTEARGVPSSLEAALTVGDRLLAALSSLQRADNAAGASGHGAIAIDQVVVSEEGKLTLTDYVFGLVLADLQWPRERMWRRFRIAMPPAAGLARFDHRVDVTQAAVVICALLAGRLFKAEEYPRDLEALVSEAVRRSCASESREDRDRLGVWLRAATELEPRSAFASADIARQALRAAFGSRLDDTAAVRRWLSAARGVPEPAPPAELRNREVPPAPAPAASPDAPAAPAPLPSTPDSDDRATIAGRLRRWMSPG